MANSFAERSGLCKGRNGVTWLCSRARWWYIYLDVIVVLARQLRGQLSFGLGTPIPQPADFGGELQAWRGEGVAGRVWRAAGRGKRGRGNRRGGRVVKATTSSQTLGVNHKRREHGLRVALWSRRLSCVRLIDADLYMGRWGGERGLRAV